MKKLTLTLLVLLVAAVTAGAQNELELVWSAQGENNGDHYGSGICGGDFNGDGYSDVLIGAFGWNENQGKDYLYFGSQAFLDTEDLVFFGDSAEDVYDFAVSNIQDVSGDAIADILIPAYYAWTGGYADVFFGGIEIDTLLDLRLKKYGINNQEFFGVHADSAGDINGDGWCDFVIAGGDYESDSTYVEIYFGGLSLDTIPDWRYSPDGDVEYEVYGLGDVNGDNFDDILIYRPYSHYPATEPGLLFFGGSPMDTIPDLEFQEYLISASGVGDINCDGYADIAAYQRFNDSTYYDVVYFGGAEIDNIPDVELTHWNGTHATSGNGFSGGDVNGDGIMDVVGLTSWNNYFVYVYLGSPWFNGMVDVWYHNYDMADYPINMAAVGDVNGDQCCDIAFGVPGSENWEPGKAFLLAGNPDLIDIVPAVEPSDLVYSPGHYKLYQNYPNPFNSSTTIRFELGVLSSVSLSIYSLSGQLVHTLIDTQELKPGGYNVSWNAKTAASGMYLLKLQVDQFSEIKKMILIK